MKFQSTLLICGLIFIQAAPAVAQESSNVKKVIESFFKGMKLGDTTMIGQTLASEVDLKSIYIDSKTESTRIASQKVTDFLKVIANKPNDVLYDERLLSFDIKIDGQMASAWTPYRFYLNHQFSHCGVNLFTLARLDSEWRIISITDTRRKADCEPD